MTDPVVRLDDALLCEMGLGDLAPEERGALLAHIHDTLEIRVGEALAERMTDEQVSRFGVVEPTIEELQKIAPDYRDVVIAMWTGLRREIEATVPQLLGVASKDPWCRVVEDTVE